MVSAIVVLNTILVGGTPSERRRLRDALVDRAEVRVIAAVATFHRACVVARRNPVDLVVLGPADSRAATPDLRRLLSQLAPFARVLIVEGEEAIDLTAEDSPVAIDLRPESSTRGPAS